MEDPGSNYSGVDNLRRLPEDILSRILSLLCTEDAVRTSVLSTRWRYLYTSISNLTLEFNSEVLKNTDEQDCMNFVDRFLFYRKKCVIDKFKLDWKMSQALDPLRLENWIKFVLFHGIRELNLCINDFEMKNLLLPTSLFTCKSLEFLNLYTWKSGTNDGVCNYGVRNYGLKLPARVCLPSLNSIHLRNVCFSEDSWSRLFTNCPVLEDFFFKFDRGYCKLSVSSPILKRLTIDQEYGYFDVFVDAPSLVYLRFVSEVQSLKLVNSRSLVEADIEYYGAGGGIPSLNSACGEWMRAISSIQTLRMCTTTLQFLEHSAIPIPVLHNTIHLTIYDCYLGLDSLPYLLEKCDYLETLVLEDSCEWPSDNRISLVESRIHCLTSVVKTIKVCEFFGNKYEFEMVKYFFKTARVLERMEIHLNSECENPSKIANWLQKLPKNSKAIMNVIF